MRRCGRCGIDKPLTEFARHRRTEGKRQHHCRECQAAYRREHYLANRAKYIAKAQRIKLRFSSSERFTSSSTSKFTLSRLW